MAVNPCRECGNEVSYETTTCPTCGVDHPARTRARAIEPQHQRVAFGCLGFFCSIVITALLVSIGGGGGSSDAAEFEIPADEFMGTSPAPSERWSYAGDLDPMTGRESRSAMVISENTVTFDFPYQGPQRGILTLRRHPSYGNDVIFQIERGRILCRSYEDCTVLVQFDEAEPERWVGRGPADGTSTVVFIRRYNQFVEKLAASHTVRIRLDVYGEGAPIFEFRVAGYDRARHVPRSSPPAPTPTGQTAPARTATAALSGVDPSTASSHGTPASAAARKFGELPTDPLRGSDPLLKHAYEVRCTAGQTMIDGAHRTGRSPLGML